MFSSSIWCIEILTNQNGILTLIRVVIITFMNFPELNSIPLYKVERSLQQYFSYLQKIENLHSGVFLPTYLANNYHKSAEAHDFLRSKFIAFSGFQIIY